MEKLTNSEKEVRWVARLLLRSPEFRGLIYIGGPRKGRFYVPVSRNRIRQKALGYFGDSVTVGKLNRVVSKLSRVCVVKKFLSQKSWFLRKFFLLDKWLNY